MRGFKRTLVLQVRGDTGCAEGAVSDLESAPEDLLSNLSLSLRVSRIV